MHISINVKVLIKTLGILTLIEGIAMVPCTAAAMYFEEWGAASSLFVTGLFCICPGFVILTLLKFDKIHLRIHEGYLIACLSWVLCSLIGAFPFYFSGQGYSFAGSFFESVAGFSTTGCTAFDFDTMPRALLLWHAVSNWLGGMGILVLLVSVFPALGISGQSIASAESTGPSLVKVGAKFSDTGKFLYLTYAVFSLVEFILLSLSPMGFFDALVNTFSSVSTGGLLITPENEAYFALPYVRCVIMIFTLLSSLNYTLFYFVLHGKPELFFRNVEVRIFGAIIAGATFLIALSLRLSGTYSSFWQAIKDGLCQVISFISTSGYFVCDYTKWPTFAVAVLFTLLFIGGCSMSTSGSLKVVRIVVLFKLIRRSIFKQIHPNSIKAVIVDGEAVPAQKVSGITSHIILFFGIFFLSALVLSLNNLDMETTLSTAIGLFTNTGMALGKVGASGNFGIFNSFSHIFLSFLMIAGRLEIYALLLLFTKTFWSLDRVKNI